MSKIQMTTLTPVHIGSGNFLQYNTEFVQTSTSTEQFLRVVDDRKVLSLIGDEHLNDWLLSIERKENIKNVVKLYAPQSKIADYSKRRIRLFSDVKNTDTLKEHIHNGFGVPYIPGSSIKGSIRTAVLASMIEKRDSLSGKTRNKPGKISAESVEKELFGEDPNSDVFRFLHVGDAYFERGTEIALRLVMLLNITENKETLLSSQRDSKSQLVEAIGLEEEAIFQLKLMPEFHKEISSLVDLFQIVNAHTQKLIEKEIQIWQDYKDRLGANEYIEKMDEILSVVKNSQANECVLRVGHASGWRFITGAWTEGLPNFKTDIVNVARPKNYCYSNYDFPKSRRTDSDGDLLGFVKLKIVE